MTKGRKPFPKSKQRAAGTDLRHAKDGKIAAFPEPVGDLTDPPRWLDEDQRAGWRYAIEHAPAGLLKELDRAVLTAFVVAENEHRKAAQTVASEGQDAPRRAVALAIMNRQAHIMAKFAAELGFTPASRGRVTVLLANKGCELETCPLAKYGLD